MKFKIGLLVCMSLIISLIRPVWAGRDDDLKSSYVSAKRKRVICPKEKKFSKKRIRKEKEEPVPTITLTDLSEEVLQRILSLAIATNTVRASDTMLSLMFVNRLTNRLITDPHLLKNLMLMIPDINLDNWDEQDENFVKQAFFAVYASKRIESLESQERYEETIKVYYRTLLHKSSPLTNSRLLAYRAALFSDKHKATLAADPVNAEFKEELKEKAMFAALSFLKEINQDSQQGRPFDLRKDEALLQLYFMYRSTNAGFNLQMLPVMRKIFEAKHYSNLNLEESNYHAHLLRLVALNEWFPLGAIAMNFFTEAAIRGDAIARFILSRYYLEYCQYPQSMELAMEWLAKAAEGGHLDAIYELGTRYLIGNGVPKDWAKSVKWLTLSADMGHTDSFYNLGICYARGGEHGVGRNRPKSMYLYTQAAEQGHAMAPYEISVFLRKGRGVPRNRRAARAWRALAAERGFVKAQYKLGKCYVKGNGVAQDPIQAVSWLLKAAQQGHEKAQQKLGRCYDNGYGVPKDQNTAIYWIQKSAEQRLQRLDFGNQKIYDGVKLSGS